MTHRPTFQEAPLPLFSTDEAPVHALPTGRLPSYIRDHRARLRERFMTGGADAMPDYELLEMVLFRANARTDMKPLARELLNKFNDFNGVVTAPAVRLAEVKGVGDAVICELKLIEAAAQRLARSKVLNRPVLSSWDALLDYCHTAMSHRDSEQFRILFLDRKNTLIADELQARGTVDHVPVYPREVVKRALELNASALILMHNHPMSRGFWASSSTTISSSENPANTASAPTVFSESEPDQPVNCLEYWSRSAFF